MMIKPLTLYAPKTVKNRTHEISLSKRIKRHAESGIKPVSSPRSLTKDKGLVVINPPYGHRIGSRSESVKLFLAVCEKLKKDLSGWKVALIAPDKGLLNFLPFSLKIQTLYHGGLKIFLLYGKIS